MSYIIFYIFFFYSGLYETFKQGMGPVGPGFKLRMGLGGNEPGMAGELYHFHNPPVGGQAGEHHAAFYKRGAVVLLTSYRCLWRS